MVRRPAPSKEETALLPPFEELTIDRIVVPQTPAQFAAAADAILAAGVAGFDTESKPTFAAGEASEGPHTVQLALHERAFIFQLHRAECWPVLRELLQSPQLLKVGFGLQSDSSQIRAKLGVDLQAVLDLDTWFRKAGYPKSIGVRAAVGVSLQRRFHKSKKTTTSNWSLPQLNERQLLYAANDAFAALKVWEALEGARAC